MENIKLNTFTLCLFNKDSLEHKKFFMDLIHDETIFKRFQGILPNLVRETENVFNKGFLLKTDDNYIGYVDISNYDQMAKCVYVRGAILNLFQGKNYGHIMLKEISDYLFNCYSEIEYIRLVIDPDNIPSIKTALSCGYKLVGNYYVLYNPNLDISDFLNIQK